MSEYFPQELLIKILVKIPPKPLIRFKCVSKSWNSLISSPHFISLHAQQAIVSWAKNTKERKPMILRTLQYATAQNSQVFSVHVDDGNFTLLEDIEIEDPLLHNVRYFHRIVASCNGVFCLCDDFYGSLRSLVLWNPAIKRKVILPLSRADGNGSSSLFALGFGYDARSKDYKVVKIAYSARKGAYVFPPEVEVYALSTRNWRKINGSIPHYVVERLWPQVFLHGNVHWTGYRRIGANRDQVENLIMLFDIEQETFDEMPLPDSLKNEEPLRLNVTAFKQSIAVGHCNVRGRWWSKSFSIWVMKNYGDKESWNKLYVVDADVEIMDVRGHRANGGALFASGNGGLHSYDPFTGQKMDIVHGMLKWFYEGPYVESLALLNEGSEARASIESELESEYKSFSSSSSDDDRFLGQVRRVEYIEFWKLYSGMGCCGV